MSFYFLPADKERPYAFLVCRAPSARTKARGFLRANGIAPRGSCFRDVFAPPNFKDVLAPPKVIHALAIYRLAGDAWLKVRSLNLPRIGFDQLLRLGLGAIWVRQKLD